MKKLLQEAKWKIIKKTFSSILLGLFVWTISTDSLCAAKITNPLNPPNFSKTYSQSQLFIPSMYGRIQERYKGKGTQGVVCIYDIHCHREAQRNIAHIIKELKMHYGDKLKSIGMEGAWVNVDVSFFASMPRGFGVRENFIEKLEASGSLTGPEYFALDHYGVKLRGIEDEGLYRKHCLTLAQAFLSRDKAVGIIDQLFVRIKKYKKKAYSKELFNFEYKRTRFADGKINRHSYYAKLIKEAEKQGIDIVKNYPSLISLVQLVKQSKSLASTRRIINEAYAVERDLKRYFSSQDAHKLDSYKKTDRQSYYLFLCEIMKRANIRCDKAYPALGAYLRYLEKFNAFDVFAIEEERKILEQEISKKLAVTQDSERVLFIDTHLRRLHNFINNTASVKDTEQYRRNEKLFFEVLAEFIKINPSFVRKEEISFIRNAADDMKDFYRFAIERNSALLSNALPSSKKLSKNKLSVFVVGGYHADGITQELRSRGISYISIIPSITKPIDKNIYLNRIKQQLKSLCAAEQKETSASRLETLSATPFFHLDKKEDVEVCRRRLAQPFDKLEEHLEAGLDGIKDHKQLPLIWLASLRKEFWEQEKGLSDVEQFLKAMGHWLRSVNRGDIQIQDGQVSFTFKIAGKTREAKFHVGNFLEKDILHSEISKEIENLRKEDGFTEDVKKRIESGLNNLNYRQLVDLHTALLQIESTKDKARVIQERLDQRVALELQTPGAGGFGDYCFFTDAHGSIKSILIFMDQLDLMELPVVEKMLTTIRGAIAEKDEQLSEIYPNEEDEKSQNEKRKKLGKFVNKQLGKHLRKLPKPIELLKKKFEIIEGRSVEMREVSELVKYYYGDLTIFYGGDLGDRGDSTFFMLQWMEELQELGINFEMIFGNHEICYILPGTERRGLPWYDGYTYPMKSLFGDFLVEQQFEPNLLVGNKIIIPDEQRPGYFRLNVSSRSEFDEKAKAAEMNQDELGRLWNLFQVFSDEDAGELFKLVPGNSGDKRRLWLAEKKDKYVKERNAKFGKDKKPYEGRLKESRRIRTKLVEGKEFLDPKKDEEFDIAKKKKRQVLRTFINFIAGYNNAETETSSGFRAVGRMSLLWWQEQYALLLEFIADNDFLDMRSDLKVIKKLMKATIEELEKDWKIHITDGVKRQNVLLFMAFQAIDYGNYREPEWWAEEWVYHSGWGPSFIEEVNKDKDKDKDKKQKISPSDFFDDQKFKNLAASIRKMKLYHLDRETGHLFIHAGVPLIYDEVKEKWTMGFTYKGQVYKGATLFEGSDILQRDLIANDRRAWAELTLWFSDLTTKRNAHHFLQDKERGLRDILRTCGVRAIYVGHNPIKGIVPLGMRLTDRDARDGRPVRCVGDMGLAPGYALAGGDVRMQMSCALHKFDRTFTVKTREYLVKKGIIERKMSQHNGREYVVLKKNVKREDIAKIISSDNGLASRIWDWFHRRDALSIHAVPSRFSIDVLINPELHFFGKSGKIERDPYPTICDVIPMTEQLSFLGEPIKQVQSISPGVENVWSLFMRDMPDVFRNVPVPKGMFQSGETVFLGKEGHDFNAHSIVMHAHATARAIKEERKKKERGELSHVLIGYDTRKMSPDAARIFARVLAGYEIKVMLIKGRDNYLSRRQISLDVRRGVAIDFGIYISGSSMEQSYNGYSVFSRGGEGIDYPEEGIGKDGLPFPMDYDAAVSVGTIIETTGDDIIESYVEEINIERKIKAPKFCISHGATRKTIRKILRNKWGVPKEDMHKYLFQENPFMSSGYCPSVSYNHVGAARLWSLHKGFVINVDGGKIELEKLVEWEITALMEGREVSINGMKIRFASVKGLGSVDIYNKNYKY